ncbi:MAG: biotin--[acetyl-CoA-carboxylase] ligase [Pseudorhodoplanes sp.]|nr:biotin--[acetyl-CoA-carboxylase] ligase [Pseudorhodoplanes sp.]
MAFTLGARAWQAGFSLQVHDAIDSTNAEALRRARVGIRGPEWIVARNQSAGRGRRGREWISPPGNLAVTLLMSVNMAPRRAALLGFVAGVALHRAVRVAAPDADIALKWPNDLLAGDAKLAGMLLESEENSGRLTVALGIGVNVAAAPQDLPYPATSLAALGVATDAETLFSALSDEWVDAARLWDDGRGFEPIRNLWLERARGRGQPISVHLADRVIAGIFDTVDETGALMIRDTDGRSVRITAGDVHFGQPARALEPY